MIFLLSPSVTDPITARKMSVEQLLDRRIHNNGLIVIHRGSVIHESYRNTLTAEMRHFNMSTTKSFIGTLAQIALEEGHFTEDELASKYVPQLQGKFTFSDVTIRDVWDMRDGTRFSEDYDDPNSDIRRNDRSVGWRPRLEGDPIGTRAFIASTLNEKVAPTGALFNYSSIQTDILGLIIEGATGVPLAEYFEEKIWSKIGAEREAGFCHRWRRFSSRPRGG